MDLRIQRFGIWCGWAMLAILAVCFTFVARLIPPMSPTWDSHQVTQFLIDHQTGLRIGLPVLSLAATLSIPFLVTVCLRLRRLEGRFGPLTLMQVFSGVLFAPVFIFLPIILATAAYRPEVRSPDVNQALVDLFWLMTISIIGPFAMQLLVLAVATFVDRNSQPVFPRWFGYFNGWCAIAFLPEFAVVMFDDGPLAWNGVFTFWIAFVGLFIWMIVTGVVMLRSLDEEALVGSTASPFEATGTGVA